MNIAYVNGDFFPESEAKISAADRGFRFGDSVFETMRLIDGEIFQFEFHKNRFRKGLSALDISYDIEQFEMQCSAVTENNNATEGFVRVQISRGVGSVGYNSTAENPTVVIHILPPKNPDFLPIDLDVSKYAVVPNSCFPKGFKTGQSLNYSLAIQDAKAAGFYDTVMLSTNDLIAETSSSNIFWIKSRKLYTPSTKTDCIKGSVRSLIMENFEVFEVEEKLETLKEVDSIFITNVGHLIKPVQSIKEIGEYNSEISKIYLGVRELLKRKTAASLNQKLTLSL